MKYNNETYRLYFEKLSGYSADFVSDYEADANGYLCDCFTEFADNNTSVYYCDQREYYNEHSEECEDALLNDGYDLNELLKVCGSLDGLICKAGMIGEYEAIYNELCENEGDIKACLLLKYIVNYEIDIKGDLDELLDNARTLNIDRINELLELLSEN